MPLQRWCNAASPYFASTIRDENKLESRGTEWGSTMKSVFTKLGVAAATVAALGTVGIVALPTASSASGHDSPAVLGTMAGHGVFNGASKSTEIAGYEGTPSTGFASASATFRAPSFSCAADATDDIQVGPVAYNSSGTLDAEAGLQPVCNDGTPEYYIAAYTTGGGIFDSTGVNAGDEIVASVEESVSGATTATVTDVTQNVTWISDESNGTSGSDDTGFSEGIFNFEGVPTFSKISMTSVQVDGQYLGQVGATQYNLHSGAKTLATASAVATYSENLSITFKNAG
jgi:hypothetical protein